MNVKLFINVNSYGGYMFKFNLLVVFLFIFCSISLVAQEDTSKTENDWVWHWNEWEDWEDWNFD